MKRKKSPSEKAAPVQQNAVVSPAQPTVSAVIPVKNSVQDTAKVVLFSVLLFFAMTVQTRQMTVVLAALALISALPIGKAPLRNLRQRLCVPVLGLLAFALMNGLAAIYSPYDADAVSEFYKIFAALSLAFILLVRFEKQHVRGLLWGFAAVCAVISLVCIDSGYSGVLFGAFRSLTEALGANYTTIAEGYSWSRINGIYNDANVSASLLALGSLVSLYLVHSGETRKSRLLGSVLLGLSALGFFLSMSRGAILCFAVALLVWLIAAGKGERLPLFFLMLFAALATVALSVPCMRLFGTTSVLPDVLAVVCGVAIFALNEFAGGSLARKLADHGRAAGLVIGVIAVACAVYCAAAVTVTGPYTFGTEGVITRYADLTKGVSHTISGQWSGDVRVRVLFQGEGDVLLDNYTVLYDGPMEETAFTLEEDGQALLRFYADPGTVLEEVCLSDGTEIALKHPLLPGFLEERLQGGLLSGISYLLRIQYIKDAWRLFTQSPLTGHGLGSTENLYRSVQPFSYESVYVHNHILQVMSDMGLLGLAGFLALLLGALWLLLRQLRKERDPLAAVLVACWVMMNAHSLMEINFSIRAYQCAAYLILLLPVLLYAKPLSSRKAVEKWGGIVLNMFLCLYLVVFGALLESHRIVEEETDGFSTTSASEFMSTLESFIKRDVFVQEQNKLTYVGNAVLLGDSRYNRNLRLWAEDLRKGGTYTACSGLARYYYLPRGEYEELFACSREGIAQVASSPDGWNLQLNFYRETVLPTVTEETVEVYVDGVLALQDYLAEYSQGRLEEIKLTEENQAFLNTAASIRDESVAPESALMLLNMLYEAAE